MSAETHDKFLDLKPGARARYEGRDYILGKILDHKAILAQDVETQEWKHLSISRLEVAADDEAPPAPDVVVRQEDYEKALKRLAAVEEFLECNLRSEAEVKRIAGKHGVSKSTLYSWVQRYLDAPQLASLIPTKPGPDKGKLKLDPQIEAIIDRALKETVRTKQRQRAVKTCQLVRQWCKAAGLTPPHDNTVRARVNALPRAKTLRERGRDHEAQQLDPIRGSYEVERPMQVVQMDHTPGNVELVDDLMRLPLGKPWITLLIDVCSRMTVGVALSMERPNAFMAGSAVANALLPKHDYLKRLGVEGEWNAWGQIGTLHMDNAREFRGEVLKTSCKSYKINSNFRPVKKPQYGGHIERLMGTMAEELRNLRGATFANPSERKGYDSEKEAVMTFSEFEAYLVDWIVNVYNKRSHSALHGMTPEAYWEEKAAKGGDELGGLVQMPPKDPERVRIDFMPFEYRTIGRKGILLDNIHYWDDIFKSRIGEPDPKNRKEKRKFMVRYDPWNVTRVWFYDPEQGRYKLIPTWNRSRAAVSLWEWRVVKAHMRQEGKKTYDEDRMFETLDRLRKRVDDSAAKTKAARRLQHLQRQAEKTAKGQDQDEAAKSPSAQQKVLVEVLDEDLPFEPFSGIEF